MPAKTLKPETQGLTGMIFSTVDENGKFWKWENKVFDMTAEWKQLYLLNNEHWQLQNQEQTVLVCR